MSDPTTFRIEKGKLVQNRRVAGFYGKKPDLELPYGAVFTAKFKIVGSHTNYNGSTYFEWVSGAGVTMYSSVRDFTEIVTSLQPDSFGYYSGMFTFVTRGGTNRSLQLVRNKLTPEPNIADVQQPQYSKLPTSDVERVSILSDAHSWLKR